MNYKIHLLNIDSKYRNTIPKNIYKSNNIILPPNCIQTNRKSKTIKINYPNHSFNIDDKIIIQNVQGETKTLSHSLYFFQHFNYLFVNFNNHGISLDHEKFYDTFKVSIELVGKFTTNIYGNVPVNAVIGISNIFLPSIIDKTIPLTPEIYSVFNVNNATELDANYFLIQLPFQFMINSGLYYVPSDVFKISFLNIGGIPLTFINADYPVNYQRNQGYQLITNIDTDNIYIESAITASSSVQSGGNIIQIMLVTNTISGYPDCNDYTILLKKSFNNVTKIELISTEFPYIDFLVKSNITYNNNKLYWQHFDDGNHIYTIQLEEGNYDSNSLINSISVALNNIPRITSTNENPIYNIFQVNLDKYSQEVTFTSKKNTNLPNSMTVSLVEINNTKYVKLSIYHPGNYVQINDIVTITGAAKIGSIIDSTYLNKSFIVYETNLTEESWSVLLGPLKQITNAQTIDITGNGGPSIVVTTNAKISFLFNYPDTLGNILAFKNVGQPNSITPFLTVTSNLNNYIQDSHYNSVGNPINYKQLFNFSGSNLYFMMYLNEYECIINNSNQNNCFAKVLLSGNPGDILFNTFVNQPFIPDFPISTLNELNISFLYPDGNLVDFRNINHSFTLRITEKISIPDNTGLNSHDIDFIDTIKENSTHI
jgi:hypothetical protein